MKTCAALVIASALLAACQSENGPPDADKAGAFEGIAQSEIIYLTGTEPFWGGEISNGVASYSTPDNPSGTSFAVERFAGLNGLGFTGQLGEEPVDLTITPGDCSDAMSDRTYPYVATVRIGDELRNGCAWTDQQPFDGPEAP